MRRCSLNTDTFSESALSLYNTKKLMLMKRIIVESGDNICNQIFFLDVSDETDFLIPPRMGELTFLILCLNSSRLARSRLHLSHFQHAEG